MSASLVEAESSSRCWEKGAREGFEKVARVEVERDAASYEASMAHIDAAATGSARTQVEFELARVQNAMAVIEKARQKAEDKARHLAFERVSLLLELEPCKDEVSAIRAKALKEKKALEEAYEEGFDMIFSYGYGCCSFAHNICRSQPEVSDGMSDTSKPLPSEFFINPRCPPGAVPAEVASIDVRPNEATNKLEREAPTTILETDNSKVGEHLSVAKVESGNEPDFVS